MCVCVCGWETRKPFGTGLKAGNPSWVNKSGPWGTVFPGALCDVWMWTQTSLHYVATALEPLVLGERPCHRQPWPAGECRRLFPQLCLFLLFHFPRPLIPFSTLLLGYNPALPLSFHLSHFYTPPPTQTLIPPSYFLFPRIFPIILHEAQLLQWPLQNLEASNPPFLSVG